MKYRQYRRTVVQDALPVGFRHRPPDLFLVRRRVLAPVRGGVLLALVGLTAGDVVAGIGLRMVGAAAAGDLVENVGPGRHGLCLQGLLLEGGGHFRPDHTNQIGLHIQGLELIPHQDVQRRDLVHSRPGRFLRRGFGLRRLLRRIVRFGGGGRSQLRYRLPGGSPPQPGEEEKQENQNSR